MPSTGTFEVKMAGSAEGARASVTAAGPPDRMMPRGSNFSILAWSTDWKGWISQYTPASRTRRAINWVTWEPKSTISKRSAMGGYKRTGGGLQCGLHPHVDAPSPSLSPKRVGLSHMGESGEKEVVVPSSLEHFVADAKGTWSRLQDVDGELSDDGEVFGSVILAAAAGIFGEQDIENPVQVVLDAPMGAHDLEQLFGREPARGQEVADLVLGALAEVGPPTVDTADGGDVGKGVWLSELRGGHDDGLPALDAAMRRGTSLGRLRWLSGGVEQRLGGREEPAAIALDGQHIVALSASDGLRRIGPAMQGIGGDKGAIEVEQGQHFEGTGDFVAIGGFALSQCHARAGRPDVDHVQRRGLSASREGPAQSLAVDADHALDAEALAELAQDRVQAPRVQHPQDVAESVVAGDAMLQLQELPQQLQSALAEELELRTGLGTSQRRGQRDDEDVHQIVPAVAGAGVLERSKHAPEFAHPCLPRGLGDTQRIQFPPLCNTPVSSYAIPLPVRGRG